LWRRNRDDPLLRLQSDGRAALALQYVAASCDAELAAQEAVGTLDRDVGFVPAFMMIGIYIAALVIP
jgi:hypothetical protein